ncbi:SulP family inorganic anion transporter [Microseira sp. BLCC-F43]|uniref:SulP family inorganic anion transporter n=1 Tax=Microseira sp. BLCC-F43 TaxID=3153602 RepID=UPI0035B8B2E0
MNLEWCRQELQPTRLLPSLTAGLVAGIFAVIYSVSFATLIFSGNISQYLPIGLGLTLFTSTVVSAIVALFSANPTAIAGPQETTAAILGLVTSTIAATMSGTNSTEEILLTVIAAIAFNSTVTAIFFLILGRFRIGELIRFVPYPVVGGFLAGSGWLLVKGGFRIVTGLSLEFSTLPKLVQSEQLINWIPALIFAVLLFLILKRYSHFLIVPGMVLAGIATFYLVLLWTGTSVAAASQKGLLLGPFPEAGMWQASTLTLSAVTGANWQTIFGLIGNFATLWFIQAISILLNISGIEVVSQRDIDLDRELKTAGIATLVSAVGGGIGGFHHLSQSGLVYRLGARSRLAGLLVALLCATMLMLGASILSFCPKQVIGGLLIFNGLSALVTWVYSAWFKFPLFDYCLIVLIIFFMTAFGFLQGVIVGMIAAVILFAINTSQIAVTKHTFSGANRHSQVQRPPNEERLLRQKGEQIHILELQGLIFFGTARKLLDRIRERLENPELPTVGFLVLDFRRVSGLDSSGVMSFSKLKQIAKQKQISLLFTNLSSQNIKQLEQGGCLEPKDPVCQLFPDLDRGLEWCENQILETAKLRRRRFLPLALQLKILLPDLENGSQLMQYLEQVQIKQGEFLLHQGDPADGFYFLESGQVSVVLELPNGQTQRLATYDSGTILGEMGLYRKEPRTASVVADQNSRLYYLDPEAFERMENQEPKLAATIHKFIVNLLAERLKQRSEELQNLLK